MGLLPKKLRVIAEVGYGFGRKIFVGYLGFLNADNIRVKSVNQRFKLVKAHSNAVGIKANYIHKLFLNEACGL